MLRNLGYKFLRKLKYNHTIFPFPRKYTQGSPTVNENIVQIESNYPFTLRLILSI